MSINFYINVKDMTELGKKYDDAINKLNDLYSDYLYQIELLSSERYWTGKSQEAFKESFEFCKLNYVRSLAKVIQLRDFISQIIQVGNGLIESRDNLKNNLE